jgi:predicted Zn-dependent peptidase
VAPTKRFTWKHKRDRFKQVQIYTGTDLPIKRGEHRPLYDALVFSNAVGESMSSRLFQEIRETKALCYSISSYRTLYTDISLWTIYSNTAPETVSRLLEALNGELRRLLVEPLTEGEVADAKNHLKGTLILAKEDMEVRMKRLFRLHSLVYEIIEYDESIKLIDEVTRRRILRITDQLLRGSQFNLVAYGGKRIKNFGGLRFEF